ncbi:MAG: ABC transporter ATP-binding protein [Candidatus Rokubacteria bacterium]|nr:ABC transporter ATP-binding protein [Candidatus Rokubacteria bacterium]
MLKIQDLHVFYGDIQALWGVSFEVRDREIVTLVGSNGAGKTTTLRTISGVLRAARGTIALDGAPIERLLPHVIVARGIGHIPEGRRLWPGMTVLENLELGAYPREARPKRRESQEWVFSLLPLLAERKTQLTGTLSGGEQQMLAIGRALMARPRLLMLDEPSLGLAPRLVAELFRIVGEINAQGVTVLLVEQNVHQALERIVGEINAQGVTVLLVEQNVHQALEIAHRAYVLETGRIVKEGAARHLLNDPVIKEAYLGL